jgi:hypothetical protein
MTAENVAVSDALLLNGVLQGARDVVLANDLRETLGTVFARQYLVGHDRKLLLYAADMSRFSQAQRRLFILSASFKIKSPTLSWRNKKQKSPRG